MRYKRKKKRTAANWSVCEEVLKGSSIASANKIGRERHRAEAIELKILVIGEKQNDIGPSFSSHHETNEKRHCK